MTILRPKHDIFPRLWHFSKFHFPGCSTLVITNIKLKKCNIWLFDNAFLAKILFRETLFWSIKSLTEILFSSLSRDHLITSKIVFVSFVMGFRFKMTKKARMVIWRFYCAIKDNFRVKQYFKNIIYSLDLLGINDFLKFICKLTCWW